MVDKDEEKPKRIITNQEIIIIVVVAFLILMSCSSIGTFFIVRSNQVPPLECAIPLYK